VTNFCPNGRTNCLSPESISSYIREEAINNCLFGINECPIPVIVEFTSGQEFGIEKAYRVGGRAAAIKLLINCEAEENSLRGKIEELEREIENYESEIQDARNEKDDAEEELEKWTDNFSDDLDTTKALWDNIEESVRNFAQIAGFSLLSDDSKNIDNLCEKYQDLETELKEADQIIGELKLENLAAQREIQNLKNKLAAIEKKICLSPLNFTRNGQAICPTCGRRI
jgi:DNA repair exonuclease SbcCD ATPase subunit